MEMFECSNTEILSAFYVQQSLAQGCIVVCNRCRGLCGGSRIVGLLFADDCRCYLFRRRHIKCDTYTYMLYTCFFPACLLL